MDLISSLSWTYPVILSRNNKVTDSMFCICSKSSRFSMVFQFKVPSISKQDSILPADLQKRSSNKTSEVIQLKMLSNSSLKGANSKTLMICSTIRNSPSLLNLTSAEINSLLSRCLVTYLIWRFSSFRPTKYKLFSTTLISIFQRD